MLTNGIQAYHWYNDAVDFVTRLRDISDTEHLDLYHAHNGEWYVELSEHDPQGIIQYTFIGYTFETEHDARSFADKKAYRLA